jgi:hypothetical protein
MRATCCTRASRIANDAPSDEAHRSDVQRPHEATRALVPSAHRLSRLRRSAAWRRSWCMPETRRPVRSGRSLRPGHVPMRPDHTPPRRVARSDGAHHVGVGGELPGADDQPVCVVGEVLGVALRMRVVRIVRVADRAEDGDGDPCAGRAGADVDGGGPPRPVPGVDGEQVQGRLHPPWRRARTTGWAFGVGRPLRRPTRSSEHRARCAAPLAPPWNSARGVHLAPG